MNIVDLVIIAIVALGAFNGYRNGLIVELASLLGFLLGIYCSLHYTDLLVLALPAWNIDKHILHLICFVFLFMAVSGITYGIGKLIEKFVSVVMLGKLNQVLGILFGIAKTAFILSAIIVLFNVFDDEPNFIPKQAREESKLYKPLSLLTPALFPLIENVISKETADTK